MLESLDDFGSCQILHSSQPWDRLPQTQQRTCIASQHISFWSLACDIRARQTSAEHYTKTHECQKICVTVYPCMCTCEKDIGTLNIYTTANIVQHWLALGHS